MEAGGREERKRAVLNGYIASENPMNKLGYCKVVCTLKPLFRAGASLPARLRLEASRLMCKKGQR